MFDKGYTGPPSDWREELLRNFLQILLRWG